MFSICQYNFCCVFVVLITIINAFNISSLEPVADSKFQQNGNEMLYENEIPVRFDDAQLWRIYNTSEQIHENMPLAELLESQYGGIIWKENPKFLDISINKDNLTLARNLLTELNLDKDVLHTNIQDMIDENELEGIMATQVEPRSLSRKSHSRRIKKQAQSGINWKDYHDLDVIYGFMREIRSKFPKIVRLYSIGKTAEGRDLKVMRISENPREYQKIWIDGGIHAREWISPATVTFILYQLMSNWENQPAYMRQRTWYFMPVMNPDGYDYSRKVNRLWRKNRSRAARSNCLGVDLNRNFNINWNGFGSSNNPCSDTYRGSAPGSELETKAVSNFLLKRKHNLKAYLTFHSYGQYIVYPWAYKAAKVKDAATLQKVGNTAVERIRRKTGQVYQSDVTYNVFGIAGGGSDDWSRAHCNAKFVYTIELRDLGKYGFQLPPSQIRGTAEEGLIVAEAVAQAMG